MSETDEDRSDETAEEGAGESEGAEQPGADESDQDEIEQERERRLAPENRPDNTEVDNTGDNAPDLSDVDPAVDDDGNPLEEEGDGPADEDRAVYPGAEESDRDEIEQERERRLAPENRPDNTEVDNTGDNAPDLSDVDPAVDDDGA